MAEKGKAKFETMKAGTKVFKCTNCNSYVSPSHKFCTKCEQALEL